MNFTTKHLHTLGQQLVLAAALGGIGFAAHANNHGDGNKDRGGHSMMHEDGGPMGGKGPRNMDPAKMQEHIAKRNQKLKDMLQITPAQEGAFKAFTDSMAPTPAQMQDMRKQHDELAKLPTPARIDKMRELRQQRDAEVAKREEATKAFYNTLSAEQKGKFDVLSAKMGKGPFGGGHEGHGRGKN